MAAGWVPTGVTTLRKPLERKLFAGTGCYDISVGVRLWHRRIHVPIILSLTLLPDFHGAIFSLLDAVLAEDRIKQDFHRWVVEPAGEHLAVVREDLLGRPEPRQAGG